MAVGFDTAGPIIEEDKSGGWQSIPASPTLGPLASLSTVQCLSSSFCVSVGSKLGSSGGSSYFYSKPVALVWNGVSWRNISPPRDKAATMQDFLGAYCWSSQSCDAVGMSGTYGGTYQTLVEKWNGSVWSRVPSRSPGFGSDYLAGMTCTNSAMCIAVGEWEPTTDSAEQLPLSEEWNGTTWTRQKVSEPSSDLNPLQNVSCLSSTDCVAVGLQEGILH